MNNEDCQICNVCESNVLKIYKGQPTTKEFLEKLKKENQGKLPADIYMSTVGTKCKNCFVCQKCDADQSGCSEVAKRVGGQQVQMMNITYFVFLTNNCNLRCDYCYATKTQPEMDEETVIRTIKFIFTDEEERLSKRNIGVQFFGGEPTVKWDLLVYFVEQANKIAIEKGTRIRWGMTTNGTLLDRDRLRWLRHHKFEPLFSIDGKRETHDKHRKTVGGKDSFDMIPINLITKYFPNAEIRPTIMPDTIADFVKNLKWFYSKGFYRIATEVAYEAEWTDEAMEEARKVYEKLGDIYIQRKRRGLPMWMKFIDDGLKMANAGAKEQVGPVCGIARNSVAIKATGDLYACQRYASFADETLKLGDIWKGWNKQKLAEANNFGREMMMPDPKGDFFCDECPALYKCRGGCNAMNYQCNGDRRFILQNHCRFHRLWAEIALRVASATGDLWKGDNRRQGGVCKI